MQVKNRVEPSQGCKTPKLKRCLRQLKLQLKNHRLSFRVNARILSALSNVLKSIFLVRFRMSAKRNWILNEM